jgi:hypothetical protein
MNFFLNCRAKLGLQNKKKFIKFGLLDAEIFAKNNFLSFGKKWYFGQKSIMMTFILDFRDPTGMHLSAWLLKVMSKENFLFSIVFWYKNITNIFFFLFYKNRLGLQKSLKQVISHTFSKLTHFLKAQKIVFCKYLGIQ